MRVQKKSSKKVLIIAILSTLLVAGVGVVTYALLSRSDENNSSTSTSKETRSHTDDTDTKPSDDTPVNSSDTPSREAEKDMPPSYEGENVDNSQTLTGVISYKSVVDGSLVIRTTINQMLGSGTCDLTMTNGSKTVTKNSGITQNPSSSSCEGFDIPVSELAGGSWKVSIVVTSGDRTGTIIDEVTI